MSKLKCLLIFPYINSSSQGFGVLSVALCSKALQLLKELLDDLQIEGFLSDIVSFSYEMKVLFKKKEKKKNDIHIVYLYLD